jgi:hypothetical protein
VLSSAVRALAATGTLTSSTVAASWLAEALVDAERHDDARRAICRGIADGRRRSEQFYLPELYRHLGRLLEQKESWCVELEHGERFERPEAAYEKATRLAERLGARSLQLRAATSWASLQCARGQMTQARELLAPLYESFEEGHDTRDLRAARDVIGVASTA